MKELFQYLHSLGWFTGELKFQIAMNRSFEGYYGRASEDWENQYHATCNEIKSGDKVLLPIVNMVSVRGESLDDFCNRVLKTIKGFTDGKAK